MALNSLDLLIDVTTGNLMRDFSSTVGASVPILKQSDQILTRIRLVTPTRIQGTPWKEVEISNTATITAAVGIPGRDFESGSLVMSYQSTAASTPLSFNPTSAEVETHLNSITTIAAAGGVSVTGKDGSHFKVIFTNDGARDLISVDVSLLFPDGVAYVDRIVTGDLSTQEVQLVSIEVAPMALNDTFTDFPDVTPVVTVQQAASATENEIQKLDFSNPEPFEGLYRLSLGIAGNNGVTDFIPYNTSADALQTIINAALTTPNITVTGAFPVYFVEYGGSTGTLVPPMLVINDSLKAPSGKEGTLDLNTIGVFDEIAGGESVTARLEVEVVDAGSHFTPLQTPVTILNDVIPNNPPDVVALPGQATLQSLQNQIDELKVIAVWSPGVDGEFPTSANTVPAIPGSYQPSDGDRFLVGTNDGSAGGIVWHTGQIVEWVAVANGGLGDWEDGEGLAREISTSGTPDDTKMPREGLRGTRVLPSDTHTIVLDDLGFGLVLPDAAVGNITFPTIADDGLLLIHAGATNAAVLNGTFTTKEGQALTNPTLEANNIATIYRFNGQWFWGNAPENLTFMPITGLRGARTETQENYNLQASDLGQAIIMPDTGAGTVVLTALSENGVLVIRASDSEMVTLEGTIVDQAGTSHVDYELEVDESALLYRFGGSWVLMNIPGMSAAGAFMPESGLRPPLSVAANRTILTTDYGRVLEFSSAVAVTFPTNLTGEGFVILRAPASGALTTSLSARDQFGRPSINPSIPANGLAVFYRYNNLWTYANAPDSSIDGQVIVTSATTYDSTADLLTLHNKTIRVQNGATITFRSSPETFRSFVYNDGNAPFNIAGEISTTINGDTSFLPGEFGIMFVTTTADPLSGGGVYQVEKLSSAAASIIPQPPDVVGMLTLTNDTGSTIVKGTPLIFGYNVGGTAIGIPATSTNLPFNTGSTAQQARVAGFAGEDVVNGATFTPVVDGEITDFPSLTTPVANASVALILSGGNWVLTNADTSATPNDELYGYCGVVRDAGDVTDTIDISVNVEFLEKSHTDRLFASLPHTPPTAATDRLYHGLVGTATPDAATIGGLTQIDDPTDPQTVSTGATTAGQYYVIGSPNAHPISTITDTVLNQVVFDASGPAQDNVFTLTENIGLINSEQYNRYVIGPLSAGNSEDYVIAF